MPIKLGELLVQEKRITPEQLQEALEHQKQSGGRLGRAFVSLGILKDDDIAAVIARRLGLPSIDLRSLAPDPAVLRLIPPKMVRKHRLLPLSSSKRTITIAMPDPTNVFAMDEIKFMTGLNVEPVVASEVALDDAIERLYGSSEPQGPRQATGGEAGMGFPLLGGQAPSIKEDGPGLTVDMTPVGLSEVDLASIADPETDILEEVDLGNLAKSSDAAPVIKLSNLLLIDSLKRGASDIHIEPYEKEYRVRFRIDGILYNVMALPMKLKDPLTSRIKMMAKLDIAEKRLPQDGRIKITMKVEDRSRALDFRVSCLPTLWGEKIVLRLLDRTKLMLDMTKLGFEPASLDKFKRAIAKPYGLVLVTGPRWSGKTNTLYSAIASLHKPDINIMTAEDPVEFNLPGINQVQIRDNIGFSLPAVLRTIQRQDPDIVVVSPVRDYETAEMAVKLALDCLVLARMEETDAAFVVETLVRAQQQFRLLPFALSRALSLVVAQRLVRLICTSCKVDVTSDVPAETLIGVGFPPAAIGSFPVYAGKGCKACNGTGYRGRIGLYEVMEIGEGIRELIKHEPTAAQIRAKALEERMLTLRMSGLEKVRQGITTIEEVVRETAEA